MVWEHRANGNFEIYKWDASLPQDGPVSVSNSPLTDSAPQIAGSNIVYQASGNGIFGIGRNDGVTNEFVSITQSNAKNPQVDGDYVVWEQFYNLGQDTEIHFYDGTETVMGAALTEQGPVAWRWSPNNGPCKQAKLAVIRNEQEKTTIYEGQIPWEEIGLPSVDTPITWSVTINDRDAKNERLGWMEWTPGLRGTQDSSVFGWLKLQE